MTRSAQTRTARTRRNALRPRLDALEDRQLLSAGALDTTTFNPPNGFVLTGFTQKGIKGTQGGALAVQVQTDGKVVAAGTAFNDFALARYNPNGSLDSTFGTGGKVLTRFVNSTSSYGEGLALQPDGKIVVAGQVRYSEAYFGVARYNANGTLDTTFGPNHNGMATVDMGATGGTDVLTVALQPDGKVLVGGIKMFPNTYYDVRALVRFDTSGNLDPTFGTGGVVTTDVSPGYTSAVRGIGFETLVVNGTPTTKIVTAGQAFGTSIQSAVVRYNLDGSLDPTFGTGGVVIDTHAGARGQLAIQPDQKIVVAGSAFPDSTSSVVDFAVARFNVDGSLDTTFNPSGPIPGITKVGNGTATLAPQGMAIQPGDGRIIVVGYSAPTSGTEQTALARFNPDGSLDTSFGTGGIVVRALRSGGDTANSVALQSDGKIVTAGGTVGSNTYFVVARFLNDTTAAAHAPAEARGSTPASGPVSLSASPSLWVPVAPSAEAFDQALGMVALDGVPEYMAPVVSLGNAGLPPARSWVRWSPQPRRFGQS